MKKQEIIDSNADCRELSIKRLPSGFGSVRYLGKGRCRPYAVHLPEEEGKISQSRKKRPPALCYVRSREMGIKILMVYHAGLYVPGLENDPPLLNRLYKKAIGQEDGEENRRGVLISWKGLSRFVISPDQLADSNSPALLNEENVQEGGDLQSPKEGLPLWNPGEIPAGTQISLADAGRTPADSESARLQNAENPGASNRNPQHILETGQAESVEDLYGRLYSLQAYINNIMEDIGRMKTDHSHISRTVPGPHEPSVLPRKVHSDSVAAPNAVKPVHADSVPALSTVKPVLPGSMPALNTVYTAFHRLDNAPALSTVYAAFHQFKYGPQAAKQLSKSSRNVTAAAYRKLACFYDRSLDEISVMEWQELVNKTAASGHSRSAVTDLVTLIRQLYRFAFPREMCTREYGNYIVMPYTSEESHHQDFTDAELKILWEHQDDPVAGMILIMCYSGFRIGEYETLKVFLNQNGKTGYFRGGIKTKAGKNRIVPIHSAIMPLVSRILDKNGQPVFFCGKSSSRFREMMKQTLVRLGIDTLPDNKHGEIKPGKSDTLPIGTVTQKSGSSPGCLPVSGIYRKPHGEYRYHTPHSSRHTFSRLCESYGVNEADRRRMLGHSFGNDITNGVYGHRSVEELRAEIEKIKIPSE